MTIVRSWRSRYSWHAGAQSSSSAKTLRSITDETCYEEVRRALSATPIEVQTGSDSILEAVQRPEVDIVLTAMVGFSGLAPTLSAIEAGKTIALSNKETLVVAGELIMSLAKRHGG